MPLGSAEHMTAGIEGPEGTDGATEVAGDDAIEAPAVVLVDRRVLRVVVDEVLGVMPSLFFLRQVESEQPDVTEAESGYGGEGGVAAQWIDERQGGDAVGKDHRRAEAGTYEAPGLLEQRRHTGVHGRRGDQGDALEPVGIAHPRQQRVHQFPAFDLAMQVGTDAVPQQDADRRTTGDDDRPITQFPQARQIPIERRPGAGDDDGEALLPTALGRDHAKTPAA